MLVKLREKDTVLLLISGTHAERQILSHWFACMQLRALQPHSPFICLFVCEGSGCISVKSIFPSTKRWQINFFQEVTQKMVTQLS